MTIKHIIDSAVLDLVTEEQREEYARRCQEAYDAAGLPVTVEIRREYGWPMFMDDYETPDSDIVIQRANYIANEILSNVSE